MLNVKRLCLAGTAVFVVQAMVAGGLQAVVADRLFGQEPIFRPEGEEKLLVYFASRVLFVALFSYLFAKSSDRTGVGAGMLYGSLIWLFYSIPMTIGMWAFLKIPNALALGWVGIGLAEHLAGGIVLGLIYKPTTSASNMTVS